jgi:hypothetical protein
MNLNLFGTQTYNVYDILFENIQDGFTFPNGLHENKPSSKFE